MSDEIAAPDEGQAVGDDNSIQTQTAAKGWTDGLNDDLRGYVEAKGFKDPGAVLESYKNLEKLRGVPEDQLLKLPTDMKEAGALDPIYDRLGRPEAPDKYTRALGEGFNDDVFNGIASEAHKLGLSDEQFAGMQKVTGSLAEGLQKAQDEASAAAFDKWKAGNEEGFNNAARLMAGLEMDESAIEGVLTGDKTALYDLLAKVAARSGESKVILGDQPDSTMAMTPARATQKVAELWGDPDFVKRYTSNMESVRQPAIDQMNKLQEIAAQKGK